VVLGGAKISAFGPVLDHPAQELLHHHHVVGDGAHGREVVGDEHVGQVEFRLQPVEQPQDALGTIWSSAEVTSSQMMKRGSAASARAMPMRCFWPPDSSPGRRSM
jgi:hypothetical protein